MKNSRSMADNNVLVTGAAGGLGANLVDALLSQGCRVFAADKNVSPGPMDGGGTFIQMDVTRSESVRVGVEAIRTKIDGLDGVVHLAGVLEVGPMLEMAETDLWRVLEVNVMGPYRVNKEVFPLLQKRNGRIVNVTSETGWQRSAPFNGAYTMSKHALESYSDALRRELQLLGMKVIKVQPGPFQTEMVHSIEQRFEAVAAGTQLFAPHVRKLAKLSVSAAGKSHDPSHLSKVICRALTARRPRHTYSVRPDWRRSLLEFLPVSVADRIYKSVLG